VVADAMAEGETVVDELSVDAFFSFGCESDEGGSDRLSNCGAEEAAARRHCFSVRQENE